MPAAPTPGVLLSHQQDDESPELLLPVPSREPLTFRVFRAASLSESQFCFLYCKTERSLEAGEESQCEREDQGKAENGGHLGLRCPPQGLLESGGTQAAESSWCLDPRFLL